MTADGTRGGGLDRYFYSLLNALPSTETYSTGVVLGDPESLSEPITNVVSFAPTRSSLTSRWARMRRLMPTLLSSTDLIVSHFAPYAFPVLDIIRKKPLVVHFHGPWAAEGVVEGDSRLKSAAKATLERIVYARGRAFIVLSEAFADILSCDYGVDRRKIHIVPGGVDFARFASEKPKKAIRERLGWPLERPIVLSVRRLVRAKGLEDLIEAAEIVVKTVPDVLFLIAGTGPLAVELSSLISARSLESNVRLIGFVSESDLPDAYRAADLFVVPTIALEGFGLVVVEALASGTPALVTPIGGLPEVVNDLSRALVLGGIGRDYLAEGIRSALNGSSHLPSEAECMVYSKRFDWQLIAKRVSEIYRDALES